MIKLLFFTCEPGGAEVIIPLIKLFLKKNTYQINVCTYGHALSRFDVVNITYDIIEPVNKNDMFLFKQYTPDIIITSATSLPYKDMSEKHLWHNAKLFNIPSIAFLDQWQNFAIRFSGANKNESLKFQPDYINVINQIGFDEMVNLGFNPNKLLQFGHPYLSTLIEKEKEINNKKIYKELNITNKNIVLFVSEAIKENFSNTRGYDQYIVLNLFLKLMQTQKDMSTIIIKLHPKDDIKNFENILNRYKKLNIILITNEYTSIEMITISQLIVGMTSIMLIEAFILNKIVFSYQPNLKIEDPLIISRKNYIHKSYVENIDLPIHSLPQEKNFSYSFKEEEFMNFLNHFLNNG